MFKGMHPVFWVGLAIMYGLTAIFMLWELNTPQSTFQVKMLGVPAPFVYHAVFMLLIVSLFLSWLWYYVPEQVAKKREQERRS